MINHQRLPGPRLFGIQKLNHRPLHRDRLRVNAAAHIPHQQRSIEIPEAYLGVDPALAPASNAFHDPSQILAGLGQAIFRPARGVVLSPDDACAFEIAKPL